MKRQDFSFDLPSELIAQYPLPNRTDSRLLVLDGNSGECQHHTFSKLPDFLQPGDCLIFNDTKVIPARLHGRKETGGKIEVLVERIQNQNTALAHIRASKAPKPGTQICFDNNINATVVARQGDLFQISFPEHDSLLEVLDAIGHIPLPPYIERDDEQADKSRYQTVYAAKHGAVAAPTAGLHFDEALFARLEQLGIKHAFVTLHVGAGTFQPVRADDIREHHMHSEYIEVSPETCDLIRQTQQDGGRVIAVGTTSVRCLESAAKQGEIAPFYGDTDIFIYPGYRFRIVDAMITNFHLPESTLLMLMCAFAGYEHLMQAYQQAIAEQYRFFSYGDAMFVTRKTQ